MTPPPRVRARTLQHLAEVLAVTAGAVGGMSCGACATQPAEAQPPTRPPDMSVVCDPLPPPIACPTALDATWVARQVLPQATAAGGITEIILVPRMFNNPLTFGDYVALSGARLVSQEVQARRLVLRVASLPADGRVRVTVPVTCAGLLATVDLDLVVSGTGVQVEAPAATGSTPPAEGGPTTIPEVPTR